ncbi:Ran-specific GTPase-activating protein 30 [Fusarium oxysporum f. sp. raphani]|uniref:Ran-specific GTPase-activating protein 30 n=1 Tax=Fusarium oxysporum f. sp. raphani TaxID=96318 RepID=A0A8J5UM18_FUSOX|nr:Ran-specific GTPase-activating protein 30 [Fusarium oxysporum f. sp. raphani]
MDEFLATVGVQAMRYAIRSGIALTSSYAVGQCSKLLKSVEDKAVHAELKTLRNLLDSKIKVRHKAYSLLWGTWCLRPNLSPLQIISPAIDLIEFKSGRGNVFLESATPLAKSLHKDIVSLGRRIESATTVYSNSRSNNAQTRSPSASHDSLLAIITAIKGLLDRIDREIPLLQLAITASGESLSTSLPAGISPSRLLQASTLLTVGDTQFAQDPNRPVQIGPIFTLSLYMLFLGHASTLMPHTTSQVTDTTISTNGHCSETPSIGTRYGIGEGERKPLWQEVLHKARVRICRTRRDFYFDSKRGYCAKPLKDHDFPLPAPESTGGGEYAYHLEVIEDLDDGRLHDDEHNIQPYDDIPRAGIRESIPVHQLSKIFYTDTGRILNIGSATDSEQRPVLLLKRDTQALPARQETDDVGGFLEGLEDDDKSETSISASDEDDQAEIDRQLLEGLGRPVLEDSNVVPASDHFFKWKFPSHLDPEWMALEVYEEDDEDDVGEDDDTDSVGSARLELPKCMTSNPGTPRDRRSLDSNVVDQIKRLSLNSPDKLGSLQAVTAAETENFVARSPFGAITTSLSLMEMLIRLASLQEFQQTSHLSIPDHILTFFLEETSTTGLIGETQWRARSEAKRRMGFDPYTDAPTK